MTTTFMVWFIGNGQSFCLTEGFNWKKNPNVNEAVRWAKSVGSICSTWCPEIAHMIEVNNRGTTEYRLKSPGRNTIFFVCWDKEFYLRAHPVLTDMIRRIGCEPKLLKQFRIVDLATNQPRIHGF